LIYLSRQLCEVTYFRHYKSGQQKGLFAGIVDNTQGVKYSLQKGMKVGAGPEQSGVGISSANLRDLLSLNTITRRFLIRQELHKHCIWDVL